MQTVTPEIRAYLDRIGFQGPLDGSAQTLAALQQAHVTSIPCGVTAS